MPRKSAAALSVIPLAPRPHPEPPRELTKAQAAIWRAVVVCRPPEYFDGACHALLTAYCRHVDAANVIAGLIEKADPEGKRYAQLLGMAVRQSNVCSMLSAKLTLAPTHVRRVEQVVRATSQTSPPWQTVR